MHPAAQCGEEFPLVPAVFLPRVGGGAVLPALPETLRALVLGTEGYPRCIRHSPPGCSVHPAVA